MLPVALATGLVSAICFVMMNYYLIVAIRNRKPDLEIFPVGGMWNILCRPDHLTQEGLRTRRCLITCLIVMLCSFAIALIACLILAQTENVSRWYKNDAIGSLLAETIRLRDMRTMRTASLL
jgi:hypothetical protein